MPYFYSFCIFLSAFLLFQIQPMLGKFVLPWFGGTPSVWSTVLLFFQTLLIIGYAYAYWLLYKFHSRRQGLVHLIFLGISLVLIFITTIIWPSPLTPDAGAWLLGIEPPPVSAEQEISVRCDRAGCIVADEGGIVPLVDGMVPERLAPDLQLVVEHAFIIRPGVLRPRGDARAGRCG